MTAMIRSLFENCAFSSFFYTHWDSLTDCPSTRLNIGLNNVETYWIFIYSSCMQFNKMWFCQQRVYMQYPCSLWLTSSQKISLFSSMKSLLTNYQTHNLIMEWSFENVVHWAIRNLNIDQISVARLRGKCWSVRRREICSPLFPGHRLRRRCANTILWYSWSLAIDQFLYTYFYAFFSLVLYASITESSLRSHNSFVKSNSFNGTNLPFV